MKKQYRVYYEVRYYVDIEADSKEEARKNMTDEELERHLAQIAMIDLNITSTLSRGEPITLTAEEVQKSIEFLMELQREQLRWQVKPMWLLYGMKIIDTPHLVLTDASA